MKDGSEDSAVLGTQISNWRQQEEAEENSLISFVCSVCGLSAKCQYGNVRVNGRTHNYVYKEEVYYMMDPFRNRAREDQRRLAGEEEKTSREEKHGNSCNILDFFVIGALCTICGQPVCIDELCSMFYAKTFCTTCIKKQKEHFPNELLQQLEAAQASRKRREESVTKPPTVIDINKDY